MIRCFLSSFLSVFHIAVLVAIVLATSTNSAHAADSKKPKPISVAQLNRSTPVDFQKEILPIFKSSCLACHNNTDAKGDVILESPATIAKGNGLEDIVVPGKGAESMLLNIAAFKGKPYMPPLKNKVAAKPLTPAELGLLKLWIDQGAKGEVRSGTGPLTFQPLPRGLNPIYSVDVSQDGKIVAAGRANQVFIYDVASQREVTRLTDDALIKSGLYKLAGVAHRDLVQAVKFSHDGNYLATAGYRVVKLWQRPRNVQSKKVNLGVASKVMAVSADGKLAAVAAAKNVINLVDFSTGKTVRSLAGHGGIVNDIKFSVDGTKLLSGSDDKTVAIWNVADGKLLGKLDTAVEVTAVAWLAKHATVATALKNKKIALWNAADVTKPKAKPAPKPEPKKDAGKKDGDKKAGEEKPVETKVEAIKPLRELAGHGGLITSLATLRNVDTQLISGSEDSTMRHWNSADGKMMRQFNVGGPVSAVAANPNGQRFAAVTKTGLGKLFNAQNGQVIAELKGDAEKTFHLEHLGRLAALQKEHEAYYKKAVDDAGKRKTAEEAAVKKATETKKKADTDFPPKEVAFTKAKTEKEAADKAVVDTTAALVKATATKTAADAAQKKGRADQKVASDKYTAAVNAFNDANKKKTAAEALVKGLDAKVKAAEGKFKKADEAAKKDGKNEGLKKAVAAAKKELDAAKKLLDDANKKVVAAVAVVTKANQAKDAADKIKKEMDTKAAAADKAKGDSDKAFSTATNAKNKAVGVAKAKVKPFTDTKAAFDAATLAKSNSANALKAAMNSLKRAVDALAVTNKGYADAQAAKKVADDQLTKAKQPSGTAAKPLFAIAFSPDDTTLVTAGEGGVVNLWSAVNGKGVDQLLGHGGAVHATAFDGAGNLWTGSADQQAINWNTKAPWKLIRSFGTGHEKSLLADRVLSLAFSHDDKRLATGGGSPSRSGQIVIFDIESGKVVRKSWIVENAGKTQEVEDPHSDTVFGLEFSFDDKHLASCGADKFVKTWTVADGKFVRAFEGHTHHVLSVSWRANGRTLASAGADNVVKIWDFVAGGQLKTVGNYKKEVTGLKYIGVTDQIITSAGDNQVRAIRDNGSTVRSFVGATDFMYNVAATPDGKVIVGGGLDSVLRIWDGTNGKSIATFAAPKVDEGKQAKATE